MRIGYVSGDFRRHSVAYFIEPVLHYHDRERFEIFCYSDVRFSDDVTQRIRSIPEHWRDIRGLDDRSVESQIRADEIDVLVDLAGHTGSRLTVFAAHPAKVNVTYLGYPNTTGLAAMDYRLTDTIADPPGEECYHTETLFRLPNGFLCFAPPADAPDIKPPPYHRNGYISFGSFNNHSKTNPGTIEAWAEILKQVPDSKLRLKCKTLGDPLVQQFLLERFHRFGIGKERIEFLDFQGSLSDHLACYEEVDIALDPFPYNGATTTCEAIWMGVPVLTLTGSRHRGRVGTSILSSLNLHSFAANSLDSYVAKAVSLAKSPSLLDDLRPALRPAMAVSPLCNGKSFASDLETAYLTMSFISSPDKILSESAGFGKPGCHPRFVL
jgi:predicted O-linked N-acetylglucosamine transferase (SPINDLY family)